MLRSSLCDYSEAYILIKWTISIAAREINNQYNADEEYVFKNCVPFPDSIYE